MKNNNKLILGIYDDADKALVSAQLLKKSGVRC